MATRILLLEDVDHLGRKGDIVNVKPGFAFNFLIPKKFALVADANAVRRQAKLQEERRLRAVEDKKAAEELATRLNGITITTEVKVDHDGHMYGSVSALDIIHMIKKETGIELEKRFILLKHAIKQTGVHDVALRLKEGVEVTVHLKVLTEHEVQQAPKAE